MWLLYTIPVFVVMDTYFKIRTNEYIMECKRIQRKNEEIVQEMNTIK